MTTDDTHDEHEWQLALTHSRALDAVTEPHGRAVDADMRLRRVRTALDAARRARDALDERAAAEARRRSPDDPNPSPRPYLDHDQVKAADLAVTNASKQVVVAEAKAVEAADALAAAQAVAADARAALDAHRDQQHGGLRAALDAARTRHTEAVAAADAARADLERHTALVESAERVFAGENTDDGWAAVAAARDARDRFGLRATQLTTAATAAADALAAAEAALHTARLAAALAAADRGAHLNRVAPDVARFVALERELAATLARILAAETVHALACGRVRELGGTATVLESRERVPHVTRYAVTQARRARGEAAPSVAQHAAPLEFSGDPEHPAVVAMVAAVVSGASDA